VKKFIALTSFTSLVLVLISCNKRTLPLPPGDGRCAIAETNITGSYKIIGARYTANAQSWGVDYMDTLYKNRLCAKDDILQFVPEGRLVTLDGETPCTPGPADKNWQLVGDTLRVQGERDAVVKEIFCAAKVMYIRYPDWERVGDELLVVYQKQ